MKAYISLALVAVAAALVFTAYALADSQPPMPDLDVGWVRTEPVTEFPKRTNDAWPLSDQVKRDGLTRSATLSDEFDGPVPDATHWILAKPDWRGRPPFTFDPANVFVDRGALVLRASARFEGGAGAGLPPGFTHTGAFVRSREQFLYGYVEVRAHVALTTVSSTFFLMESTPATSSEIDVYEIAGADPVSGARLGMSRHVMKSASFSGTEARHPQRAAFWNAPFRFVDGWHVFGLQWEPDQIAWYVDGVQVHRAKNEFHHQPLRILIDLEAQVPYQHDPAEQLLPAEYRLDYVRVWTRPPAAPAR